MRILRAGGSAVDAVEATIRRVEADPRDHSVSRYGACACTGYGEMALRCNTAHSVVLYMKVGLSLERACGEAMTDLRRPTVPFPPRMSLVAVDARGQHAAMTTEVAREVRYEPAVQPRLVVPLRATRRRKE